MSDDGTPDLIIHLPPDETPKPPPPRVYRSSPGVEIWHGDAIDVLRLLDDESVHNVVTDPPYGISFLESEWDRPGAMLGQISTGDEQRGAFAYGGTHSRGYADHDGRKFQLWCEKWARECYRVLVPGGHLLAFGAARTGHRLASGIEDAGFEIRDGIAWLYGQGIPKGLDVAKAIDKTDAGRARLARARQFQAWLSQHITPKRINELTGTDMGHHLTTHPSQPFIATGPMFDLLRPELPAVPPEIEALVRQRTVESENFAARAVVGQHRHRLATGAHGVTVSTEPGKPRTEAYTVEAQRWDGWNTQLKTSFEPVVVGRKALAGGRTATNVLQYGTGAYNIDATRPGGDEGRHTPNVVIDEHAAAEIDRQAPSTGAGGPASGPTREGAYQSTSRAGAFKGIEGQGQTYGEQRGASQFFPVIRYEPKAASDERPDVDGTKHPTVKPLELMRWLCRLVTPPGGVVLDPFLGSGTTAEAAIVEGFSIIGVEREAAYLPLIDHRLDRGDPATALEQRLASDDTEHGRLF